MAEIPKNWKNVARRVVPLEEVDLFQAEVEGGCVRRPVPCDGLLVVTPGDDMPDIFIPLDRVPEEADASGGADEVGADEPPK